jgi:Mg/Co/Ni transporter MgtE
MIDQNPVTRKNSNSITRKHLFYSLATGLVIGIIAGTPIGWFANQFYSQQRLAQNLLCRERNRDKPAVIVDSLCGKTY